MKITWTGGIYQGVNSLLYHSQEMGRSATGPRFMCMLHTQNMFIFYYPDIEPNI